MRKASLFGAQGGANENNPQSHKENFFDNLPKETGVTESTTEIERPEITPIDGTPFATVKTNLGYMVIFGNTIINKEPFETHADACAEIGLTDWITLLNAVETLFNHMFEKQIRTALSLSNLKS